ncbi:hypothetical protein [Sphingopyxis sp.]|uniref:hypothetical protein n=1 Tax=Sphingopyxis sp. TaxID=1908224 RepID=UPI003D09AC31
MIQLSEGQVWEFRARGGEKHALVKIQKIELHPDDGDEVFHISMIGLRCLHGTELPHAPVSRQTLENSITRLAQDFGQFPDYRVGLAEWRRAKGGVFSISLAEIIQIGDIDHS